MPKDTGNVYYKKEEEFLADQRLTDEDRAVLNLACVFARSQAEAHSA